MDSMDGNRKLDKGEFYGGLLEQGVKLSRSESDVPFPQVKRNQEKSFCLLLNWITIVLFPFI